MIAQTLRTLSVWILLIAPVFLPTVLSEGYPDPVFELCVYNETVTEEGDLTTQNYPSLYDVEKDCAITITASPGKIVQLTFDAISIGYSDILYVYDGNSTNADILKESSATNSINYGGYRSSGQSFHVRFISDGISSMNTGFLANVKWIEDSDCSNVALNQEGQIMSPNYPANYDNKLSCDTLVTAGPGQIVQLIFRNFSIEESDTCAYDTFEVFDGSASDDKPVRVFECFANKTLPGDVVSSGRSLYVLFTSDSFGVRTGFLADVIFLPEISVKRGVTLKQGRGWPGGLIADLEFNIGMCEWSRIEVTFPRRVYKVQVTGCDADLDVSVKSELNSGGNQGWMSVATIVPSSSDRSPSGADGNTRLSIYAKIWRELRRFKADIKADIHYYTC